MQVLRIRHAQAVHLLPESAVCPLIVHLLLFLGGVADASCVESLHAVVVLVDERYRWRLLGGMAAQQSDHLPSCLGLKVFLRNSSIAQDVVELLLFELSKISLGTSHCFGILDGWVEVHAIGLGTLDRIS